MDQASIMRDTNPIISITDQKSPLFGSQLGFW